MRHKWGKLETRSEEIVEICTHFPEDISYHTTWKFCLAYGNTITLCLGRMESWISG